jgi:hypothetical protein
MKASRQSWIKGEKYVLHLIPMFESPAFRVLSRAAYQVLVRLEIELSRQAGKSNGVLIVTFAQLEEYGVHRHAIAPAIRELVALGFIEITEQGRAGNAEWRRPTKYRITYLPTDDADPTHGWRQITEDDAEMIAQGARRAGSNSAKATAPKKQKPTPGKRTDFAPGKRTSKPGFSPPESAPRPRKAHHYLDAYHLVLTVLPPPVTARGVPPWPP